MTNVLRMATPTISKSRCEKLITPVADCTARVGCSQYREYPSGLARKACRAPTLPVPPEMLATTRGSGSWRLMNSTATRAETSLPPPGGKATTSCTGFSGYAPAVADAANASNNTTGRKMFFMSLSLNMDCIDMRPFAAKPSFPTGLRSRAGGEPPWQRCHDIAV